MTIDDRGRDAGEDLRRAVRSEPPALVRGDRRRRAAAVALVAGTLVVAAGALALRDGDDDDEPVASVGDTSTSSSAVEPPSTTTTAIAPVATTPTTSPAPAATTTTTAPEVDPSVDLRTRYLGLTHSGQAPAPEGFAVRGSSLIDHEIGDVEVALVEFFVADDGRVLLLFARRTGDPSSAEPTWIVRDVVEATATRPNVITPGDCWSDGAIDGERGVEAGDGSVVAIVELAAAGSEQPAVVPPSHAYRFSPSHQAAEVLDPATFECPAVLGDA